MLHCLSPLDTVTLKFLLRTLAITLGEWLAIAAWLVLSLRTLCRRFFLIVLHNVFLLVLFSVSFETVILYIFHIFCQYFFTYFLFGFLVTQLPFTKRFLEVFLFLTNFHSKTIFRDIWFIANFFYNSKYYLYWLAIHEENSISIFSTSLLLFTCLMYQI